ncbi:MAG: CMP deaminase [Crenarchaeota archaeon]|nr:MAG: CMP deaminase [Thermoproteota archaeon]
MLENDQEYLKHAYIVAAVASTDPSTQNGAILVNPNTGQIVADGANHFPEGVEEKSERWERPIKYSYVEHAERNCIFTAARNGVATEGLVMYCCWAACADCSRAIIQARISEVVTHYNPNPPSGERFGMPVHPQWKESIEVALGMMKEAGVKIRWIEDKLYLDEELQIRFNGTLVTP